MHDVYILGKWHTPTHKAYRYSVSEFAMEATSQFCWAPLSAVETSTEAQAAPETRAARGLLAGPSERGHRALSGCHHAALCYFTLYCHSVQQFKL